VHTSQDNSELEDRRTVLACEPDPDFTSVVSFGCEDLRSVSLRNHNPNDQLLAAGHGVRPLACSEIHFILTSVERGFIGSLTCSGKGRVR